MHLEAHSAMVEFVVKYVREGARVADIGSGDVNGTFRHLFPHCEYVGLDVEAGPNVDRVITTSDFGEGGFDVVISGNTMEHVEDLSLWSNECIRLAKPGGYLCIIAPHGMGNFDEHFHPLDCWRIWPDGMRWLFRRTAIIECRRDQRDTVLIAQRL
jgi:SAM-dependent methyltransferase